MWINLQNHLLKYILKLQKYEKVILIQQYTSEPLQLKAVFVKISKCDAYISVKQ